MWVKLWEVADVVAEFRRKGLLFRDFAGKDFESCWTFSFRCQAVASEIFLGRLWDVGNCFRFLRSYSLFEGFRLLWSRADSSRKFAEVDFIFAGVSRAVV